MKTLMVVSWFIVIVAAEIGKWYAAKELLRLTGFMK